GAAVLFWVAGEPHASCGGHRPVSADHTLTCFETRLQEPQAHCALDIPDLAVCLCDGCYGLRHALPPLSHAAMSIGEDKLRRRRPAAILLIVGALFIIVPFWAWYATWFGRTLTDSQMASYLADREKPRHVQHALTQLERRIRDGDQEARRW